ncbi:glutamate receptor ionotropic, delta-1-like [Branchiostoma floridae x Branchiostoma belcheri]
MMKTHGLAATLFVLAFPGILLQATHGYPDKVTIGAFFEEPTTAEETAFKYAVDQINRNNSILPGVKLLYKKEVMNKSNPFLATIKVCSLMTSQIAALVSITSQSTNTVLQSMTNTMTLPHLYVPRPSCNCNVLEPKGYSLSMRPRQSQLDQALLTLIKQQHWRSIVLIYDESYDFERLQTLIIEGTTHSWDMLILRVSSKDELNSKYFRKKLKSIDERNFRYNNVVVLCSPETTVEVLYQANEMHMVGNQYLWVIANEEISDRHLDSINITTGMITGIRKRISTVGGHLNDFLAHLQKMHPGYSLNFILPTLQDFPLSAAYSYDAVWALARTFDILIKERNWTAATPLICHKPTPWLGGKNLLGSLRKNNMSGLNGPLHFNSEGYNDNAEMEILSLTTNDENITKFWAIGTWNVEGGLNLTEPAFTREIHSFENTTLTVVTLAEKPFIFKDITEDGPPAFRGFLIDVLNELKTQLKFSYTIFETPDQKYGAKNDDTGEWNGMVGQLVQKRAHIAVSALTITSEREDVVDFTKPYMDYGATILLKKPEQKYNVFAFLEPFNFQVWACILGSILIVGFILYILNRISPYSSFGTDEPDADAFNLSNSVWFAYGSLVQQGGEANPRASSGRMLSGFWWFFTLIMISTYTANLAAFLTVTRMDTPVRSVDDLAAQTSMPYGTVEDSSLYTFFKASSIGVYERMWDFMNNSNTFATTVEDGYAKVLSEDYAFIWENPSLDYLKLTNCDYTTIGRPFNMKGYGIALQEGMSLRDQLSISILKMQESGKMDELKGKWWPTENANCPAESSSQQSKASELGLNSVAGVFYVLALGVGISIVIVLIEIIWWLLRGEGKLKRPKPKNDKIVLEEVERIEIKHIPNDSTSSNGKRKIWTHVGNSV